MLRKRCFGVRAGTGVVGDRGVEEGGAGDTRRREKCMVLRVGLVCGGPSAERGISLNSARSVLDHIQVLLCTSKSLNARAQVQVRTFLVD